MVVSLVVTDCRLVCPVTVRPPLLTRSPPDTPPVRVLGPVLAVREAPLTVPVAVTVPALIEVTDDVPLASSACEPSLLALPGWARERQVSADSELLPTQAHKLTVQLCSS